MTQVVIVSQVRRPVGRAAWARRLNAPASLHRIPTAWNTVSARRTSAARYAFTGAPPMLADACAAMLPLRAMRFAFGAQAYPPLPASS